MRGRLDQPDREIAAAVLAGGAASRFGGRAKGLLRLAEGVTIIERLIGEIAGAGIPEVVLCGGREDDCAHHHLSSVPDLRTGAGPVAGVESGLHYFAGRYAGVLLLPCDLPAITRVELRRLCSAFVRASAPAVVAETATSFWHPLCAVARTDLASAVSESIDRGTRSVYRLWLALEAAPVRFHDPMPFFNVNTPEDWADWLSRAERSRTFAR